MTLMDRVSMDMKICWANPMSVTKISDPVTGANQNGRTRFWDEGKNIFRLLADERMTDFQVPRTIGFCIRVFGGLLRCYKKGRC